MQPATPLQEMPCCASQVAFRQRPNARQFECVVFLYLRRQRHTCLERQLRRWRHCVAAYSLDLTIGQVEAYLPFPQDFMGRATPKESRSARLMVNSTKMLSASIDCCAAAHARGRGLFRGHEHASRLPRKHRVNNPITGQNRYIAAMNGRSVPN
jgi:hypothetical protein